MADAASYSEWIKFAQMDFDTAEHLYSTMQPKPLEIICYHCQQAVEKLLKAILISNGCDIIKTHDLGLLAEQCMNYINVPEEIQDICDNLTPYGVKIRYPQELFLEDHHAKRAISDAERLFEWFRDGFEI